MYDQVFCHPCHPHEPPKQPCTPETFYSWLCLILFIVSTILAFISEGPGTVKCLPPKPKPKPKPVAKHPDEEPSGCNLLDTLREFFTCFDSPADGKPPITPPPLPKPTAIFNTANNPTANNTTVVPVVVPPGKHRRETQVTSERFRFVIERRDGSRFVADYQQTRIIEAARLPWQSRFGMPPGLSFSNFEIGNELVVIYREPIQ